MNLKESALILAYALGDIATFIYLIVEDTFNWWNWIILIPINFSLASIWPIYWVILVPLFGLPGTYAVARLFGAVVFGALCGLAPYLFAKKKGRQKLAAIALFSCIASGLIAGIVLALPVALLFLGVIAFAKRAETDVPAP